MAGDDFKKKLRGQPWRPGARAVSAFMDAAADAKAQRAPTFGSEAVDQFRQSGIVKVLNASGAPVPRYGVLGLASPVVTPAMNLEEFQRQVAMNGATPAAAQAGNFVVMLDGVPAGAVGRGVVSGVTPCQVKVGSGGFADLLAGDATQLQQQASGAAQILWQDPAVGAGGTAWAVVRIGQAAAAFHGFRVGVSNFTQDAPNVFLTVRWDNGSFFTGYDTDGYFALPGSVGRVPAGLAGYYSIGASLWEAPTGFVGFASGAMRVALFVNTGSYAEASCPFYTYVPGAGGFGYASVSIADNVHLSVGDSVSVEVWQSGGASMVTGGSLFASKIG